MRNGVRLGDIRKEIMIEAGFSTDAGHAIYSKDRINQMVNRVERRMATVEDWPNMSFEEQVTIPADTRYVTLPANLALGMIDRAWVKYGTDWVPVSYGISARERSVYNEDQRSLPITRWEAVAPGDSEFEVWPIGGSDQTMLFEGTKKFGAMVSDSDTCVLDADVIVLRVAAQILGRDRKDDAALMLQEAQDLTASILKRLRDVKADDVSLTRRHERPLREGIDYIAPGRR